MAVRKPAGFAKPGRKPKQAGVVAGAARFKKETPQHDEAVRFLASVFGKDVRKLREIIRQGGQSNLTPKWAAKQLKQLQELIRVYSKYQGVSLDWRNYPQLIVLRPYDMSAAVQKEADAIASGAKPLQKEQMNAVGVAQTKKGAAPGAKPLKKEQIQPAAKIPEIDISKERAKFFYALAKHRGLRAKAARALGIVKSTFSSRAKQLGISARESKKYFIIDTMRRALIESGGNAAQAAKSIGMSYQYFLKFAGKYGLETQQEVAMVGKRGRQALTAGQFAARRDSFLDNLRDTLEKTRGHIGRAADILRLTRQGLYNRAAIYGVDLNSEASSAKSSKRGMPLAVGAGPRMPKARVYSPIAVRIREGIAAGTYDELHPPSFEAVEAVANAANFDFAEIQRLLKVDYTLWHRWLDRLNKIAWFERESRFVREQRDAERERAKSQRIESMRRMGPEVFRKKRGKQSKGSQ